MDTTQALPVFPVAPKPPAAPTSPPAPTSRPAPTSPAAPGSPAARALAGILSPALFTVAVLLIVAIHTTIGIGRGLLLGAVTAVFIGGLPHAILPLGARRPRPGAHALADTGTGVRGRPGRTPARHPAAVAAVLASIAVGLLLSWSLDAPRAQFALVAALLATIAVTGAVSAFRTVSVHTATAAGTAAVLVLEFGPALWAVLPVVAAVGWARVRLGDHTVAQVTGGAIVGFCVAAGVMGWLR